MVRLRGEVLGSATRGFEGGIRKCLEYNDSGGYDG
jgi:hypothetical protein